MKKSDGKKVSICTVCYCPVKLKLEDGKWVKYDENGERHECA